MEHAHIAFDSPFGPENAFHFKIGKFTPNVADVFQEMWITTDAGIDSVFNYNPIGLNGGTGLGADEVISEPIPFPALVQGIELYGIVEAPAALHGGGRPTASPPATASSATTRRTSTDASTTRSAGWGWTGTWEAGRRRRRTGATTLSAWARSSTAARPAASTSPSTTRRGTLINVQDDHFLRTGFFASAYWHDLNVFGAYVHGKDTLRQFDPRPATS